MQDWNLRDLSFFVSWQQTLKNVYPTLESLCIHFVSYLHVYPCLVVQLFTVCCSQAVPSSLQLCIFSNVILIRLNYKHSKNVWVISMLHVKRTKIRIFKKLSSLSSVVIVVVSYILYYLISFYILYSNIYILRVTLHARHCHMFKNTHWI